MRGFDPKFADLPDYILGVTEEIWEQRQVDTLVDYYTDDIPVRAPGGLSFGNRNTIDATWATLAEFPDRQLLGEDVIWSGDDESGYLSSHRILSTATHDGDGSFGAATGRKLRYRVVADCAARENQIFEEWIVRDQGAIVRQLGVDPRDFAMRQIEQEGGVDQAQQPASLADTEPTHYFGTGNDHEHGERLAEVLTGHAQGSEAFVAAHYDRAVTLELPGGHTAVGRAGAHEFWRGLVGSVPAGTVAVHHQIGRDDPLVGARAAVRWSLSGTHDGAGLFGEPSGAELFVMGITHVDVGPRGIRREFTLIDEVAIWKQILLHTG